MQNCPSSNPATHCPCDVFSRSEWVSDISEIVSIRRQRQQALHPVASDRIFAYLETTAHHQVDSKAPLFLPLRGPATGAGISADSIYALGGKYAKAAGIEVAGVGVHGLRATAATNALEHDADIAKVQAWLGRANISTTRLYDRRSQRPIR